MSTCNLLCWGTAGVTKVTAVGVGVASKKKKYSSKMVLGAKTGSEMRERKNKAFMISRLNGRGKKVTQIPGDSSGS